MNSLQKYLSSEAHNWFSRIDYKTRRCASEVGTLERGGSGRDSTAAAPRALGRPAPSEPRALAAPTAGRSGSGVTAACPARSPGVCAHLSASGGAMAGSAFALTLPVSSVCLS